MKQLYDLRSDTVTRPSPAMRQAMAEAPVGDDVYGEDPSVRELEEAVADLLGKEAGLFVPSGTMANQIALLSQTRPGDEVVVGERAHIAWHESGAGAAWAGVQFCVAGRGGLYNREEFEAAVKPDAAHCPNTALVCVENTHNMSGGRVFPQGDAENISNAAARLGMRSHLDGARLWNASVSANLTPAELARPFDSVSVCFSKGLGAPVGSMLVGSTELVAAARRFRKMLGGGMRQAGILASGALFALRHHYPDDIELSHQAARSVAEILSTTGARVVAPQTNIVMLEVDGDAHRIAERARTAGVLVHALNAKLIRLVTHRDLSVRECSAAAHLLARLLEGPAATGSGRAT
jgi:threonine aldolase